jgi:hypothetical protein
MRMRRIIAVGSLLGALIGTATASARPVGAVHADACQHSARRYEERCLMPRIEARVRFGETGDALGFVERMRDIDQACAEVTATGLAGCVAWPRVRPTAEYRRWLRDVREAWERRQQALDGTRPACPPGVPTCL